jgi:hypothetical protein
MLRRIAVMAVFASLAGCSASPRAPDPAQQQAGAAVKIAQIPPADPAKYDKPSEIKAWKNPYLMLRETGVGLVDRRNDEIRILKPDEIALALANLPNDAWPYGRVVAVQELPAASSDAEAVQHRANRGEVAGELERLHIAIKWIPAS